MVIFIFNPSTQEARAGHGLCELKDSLVYTANSRLARATEGEAVSKQQNNLESQRVISGLHMSPHMHGHALWRAWGVCGGLPAYSNIVCVAETQEWTLPP